MYRIEAIAKTSTLVPVLLLSSLAASAQYPAYVLVSAPLPVDQKTVIPGRILNAGTYSIRVVDHLKDRYILSVEDSKGTPLSTFIGLHNPEFETSGTSGKGPIFWSAAPKKDEKAVRGFSFADGNTLEFVYPKAEAVSLAKLNTNSVPAIDPESEGRKPDPKLSPEDRQVVTLWMLSATRVGPKDDTPAIAAKRFIAPSEDAASPAPVQSAAAANPPIQRQQQARPAPVQIAKAEPAEAPRVHSSVKKLPQTASDLPLLLLFSFLALSAAATLRISRARA